MLLKHRILMDKVDDNGSPSGYGTETPTPATTPETPKTQGDTSDGTKGNASGEGTPNTPATGDDKSKSTASSEPQEDVTGYKADKPAETPSLELDVEGLSEDVAKDVQEFAKTANLTKEQAQAYVEKVKANEAAKAAATENYKIEEAKVFQKWETELKADPEFGGENFAYSVNNVNKLLREELPGFKNILTTSGKRLPPSIMKDLNNVARKLYGETEFNQGNKTSTKDTWNPLDFYKQKQ